MVDAAGGEIQEKLRIKKKKKKKKKIFARVTNDLPRGSCWRDGHAMEKQDDRWNKKTVVESDSGVEERRVAKKGPEQMSRGARLQLGSSQIHCSREVLSR